MEDSRAKQVSCYLNDQIKQALEKEANYYKSQGDDTRDSINKNMVFIIDSLIDEYADNIAGILERFTEVLSKSFDEIGPKDISRTLKVTSRAYPLKFTAEFSEKFDKFRLSINKHFNIKITKMNLYNFILLDYYIRNKVQIAKKDLLFWMQDYFSRSKSMVDFKDILQMFNEFMQKEEIENEKNK